MIELSLILALALAVYFRACSMRSERLVRVQGATIDKLRAHLYAALDEARDERVAKTELLLERGEWARERMRAVS